MKQNNIIELSAYTAPEVIENPKLGWVEYGNDNNYYKFLIDRYSHSATNNAVINNISRLIYGKGLSALDASKKPNEYAQFLSMLSNEDMRRAIKDLYMLGQCAFQVHFDKGHKTALKLYHMPIQLLRPEKCNKEGEIVGYYYSDNWEDVKKYVPKRFNAFGQSKDEVEILYIQPYSVGMKYFSSVDYQGALDYTFLEEKISEYLINDVINGFSPTSIVNFNNGTPTDEQKDEIARNVINKLTGSTGKKVVVSFNESQETQTTIDAIPLNNAPEHYQYLADECRSKILTGHCVTSPLIFGIATTTGFSSNADELKNSVILFDNMVIRPKQDLIVDFLDKVLAFNGYSLDLYFTSLQPLDGGELTDNSSKKVIDAINSLSPLVANKVLESMTSDEVRSLVGLVKENPNPQEPQVQMSAIDSISLDGFGEDIDENEWILVDSRKVDYELEDSLDAELEALQEPTLLSKVLSFVKTGTARPNATSEQDGKIFKTRYRYTGNLGDNSRDFCKKMIGANKVYRKEDIIAMGSQAVNEGWGPKGADNYDIWLYKGGGDCHHFWTRETYLKKSDVNSPLAKKFTAAQSRKAGEIAPTNDKRVYTAPKDMPFNGFLPTNKRFN